MLQVRLSPPALPTIFRRKSELQPVRNPRQSNQKNVVASYNAQESTREAEQRFSELAENSDDILFSFTADWRELLFINSSFEDFWGFQPRYLRRIRRYSSIRFTRMTAKSTGINAQTIERGTGRDRISRDTSGAGLRWVRGQSKPIFDDDGAVVRIVGSVQEIAH